MNLQREGVIVIGGVLRKNSLKDSFFDWQKGNGDIDAEVLLRGGIFLQYECKHFHKMMTVNIKQK